MVLTSAFSLISLLGRFSCYFVVYRGHFVFVLESLDGEVEQERDFF